MFSIADIQAEEEDYQSEQSEGEDAAAERDSEDEPLHSYPIRASLSITKVGRVAISGQHMPI